jgi:hypothetical protein
VTRSNPFLPSNQSFRAALLVRFRPVTRYQSVEHDVPAVRSSLRGRPRLPENATKSGAVSRRITHRAAPFFRRHVANVVFSQSACGRSPGSLVACDFRLRSRPIPRRPVKDAVFLARRIFHRRVLFPQRSPFDEHRSNVLSLVRGAGALLETAVSCASHRRVTGCFRFRRHRDSAR